MRDVKDDWEYMRGRREMKVSGRHQGGLKNKKKKLKEWGECRAETRTRVKELPVSITYFSERARKQGGYA